MVNIMNLVKIRVISPSVIDHTVKKSKETKIAKHPPRFLIYGAKMLDKGVAASKIILALCLF